MRYTLHAVRTGEPAAVLPDTELVLSRFAILRRDGDGLVLESPRSSYDLRVHDDAVAAVLAAFAHPLRAKALPPVLPDDELCSLVADLWSARFLVEAEASEEDTELRLRQWSPFELWLHTRSRLATGAEFNGAWGLTGWGEGEFPPLPARPEPYDGQVAELVRPDLDALRGTDPTLTTVLEDRTSVREHDNERPIGIEQLGEFLFRCARAREVHLLDGIEHVDRPYPSGGALHELELYAVARNVAGLAPGFYHYDSHEHRLVQVSGETATTRRLVETAELATAAEAPQVVLLVAARFGRLMWKYEAMGYAAILKNVGVLYQVMYSVATAMGLAACAIGGGDAATFNEATGRDYFTEGVVGEFLLGSRTTS